MITKANKYLLFLLIPLLFSCNGLKRLKPGEKLYTGYSIKLENKKNVKNERSIREQIRNAVTERPNKSFLGLRPRLWLWQIAGDPKKKGFRKWLKNKGEPPVLMNDISPVQVSRYIDAALFNIGIFNSLTAYKIIEHKRSAKVVYTVYVHPAFKIKDLSYEIKDDAILHLINSESHRSFISRGENYGLDKLKAERERMNQVLKNHGYYFFHPDYFFFRADTIASERSVNLKLLLKNETPEKALKRYRIGKITVDHDKMPGENEDSISANKSFIIYDSVYFSSTVNIRKEVLRNSILLRSGELYSLKEHNATLNRLMSLGAFKFARIKITERDSSGEILDLEILLNPMPKRTIRTEMNLVSKSNDFIGPHLDVSHLNRNSFNGAELFRLNAGGSFETQLSGKYKNLFAYTFNSKAELSVPGFVLPFKVKNVSTYYVPKTNFSLGYNYLKRLGYFDMRSLSFVYGFRWKENAMKEHELNPVNLNIANVTQKTPEFENLLETYPYVRKSYDEQFIPGALYSFDYNEQVRSEKRNQVHTNLTSEASGNLLSLAFISQGRNVSPEDPAKIFGLVYSQFLKISGDARDYLHFRKSSLAFRLFSGVGRAYGNSNTLPYLKQFFSGGPNSVRAFPINSIGPGTLVPANGTGALFLQQGGDIKLEANIEYRFDIIKSLKGAVFTDAGNIWLMRTNPSLPENVFQFSEFYKQLAIGSGVGLRFDFSFLVLRFDLATPLRKPWLPEKQRWVLYRFDPLDPSWRSENLILNVAIGYPF